MKTVTAKDGTQVIVLLERGMGDGGAALRYFVDQGDDTYIGYSEWQNDPAVIAKIYAAADPVYFAWVAGEAQRRQVPPAQRAAETAKPDPLASQSGPVIKGA